MAKSWALITGATSGIGLALARIHAAKGGHLFLVARREAELLRLQTELKTQYGVEVNYLVQDLGVPDAALKVWEKTKSMGIRGMSVYFATKSYVLSFTEALHEEVNEFGIRVSALCPGPTSTQFFDAANMSGTRLTRLMPMPGAEEVAQLGYDALTRGKAVQIYGAMNQFLVFLLRFTPRKWVRKLSKKIIGI